MQEIHRTIKALPPSERPRERLLAKGVEHVSDTELLAIILGSGTPGGSALELARNLLICFGDFRRLADTTISELMAFKGIGPAKAIGIKACLEIARRFGQQGLTPGQQLNSSRDVFEHFHEILRDRKKELFFAVLLDTKNRIIRKELISVGSLSLSVVHPREVFVSAIRESAGSVLFVHNHPSGDPTPSREDLEITYRLKQVGQLIGIEVLDHIIVGNGDYISLAEHRLL